MKTTTVIINSISIFILLCLFMLTPIHLFQKLIIIYPTFAIWLISANNIDNNFFSKSFGFWGFFFCFAFLWYIYSFYNTEWEFLHFVNHIFLTYMWILMFVFYSSYLEIFSKLVYPFLFVILISCLFTVHGNIVLPGASRTLASVGHLLEADREMAIALNVGGFGFIYSLTFMIVPLMSRIRENKKDIIMWIILLVTLATIVVASYFMAILFAALFLFISLSSTRNILRSVIIIVILSLILYLMRDDILIGLVQLGDYIDSPMLQRRAEQMLLGTYQSAYDESGDESRVELIQNGIQNFLSSPIIGQMRSDYTNLHSGHSEMIGYFEKYGIFGFIYIAFFMKVYKVTRRCFKTKKMSILYSFMYVGVMTLVTLNTFSVSCEAGLVGFFVVPILMLIIEQKSMSPHLANFSQQHRTKLFSQEYDKLFSW